MTTIHLVEGPVGAGKSTFAARLSADHAAPHLDLDEWMVTLFSPDRPGTGFVAWYSQRKQRCIEQIWHVTCELMRSGTSVVLELGLVQRQAREEFYQRVDASGYELAIYVLDAPEEERRRRVRERNGGAGGTFKMQVTDEIFDIASRAWEPPDPVECAERPIRLISAL